MPNKDSEILQEDIPLPEAQDEHEVLSDDIEDDGSEEEKVRYTTRASTASNRSRRLRQAFEYVIIL